MCKYSNHPNGCLGANCPCEDTCANCEGCDTFSTDFVEDVVRKESHMNENKEITNLDLENILRVFYFGLPPKCEDNEDL